MAYSKVVSIPYSSGLSFRVFLFLIFSITIIVGLNPLFIRSQFQSVCNHSRIINGRNVSIPYSSGLSFRDLFYAMSIEIADVSQSLIHQVSVSEIMLI